MARRIIWNPDARWSVKSTPILIYKVFRRHGYWQNWTNIWLNGTIPLRSGIFFIGRKKHDKDTICRGSY